MAWSIKGCGTAALLCLAVPATAQTTLPPALPADAVADASAYRAVWSDAAIQKRIAEGIERNRKDRLTITVVDAAGKPVAGQNVKLRQTARDFKFGANGFMIDGYAKPEQNKLWEKRFTTLFDLVTVPFFWKDFEPQPGQYRIAADSPPIYRRPPIEVALDFAKRNGLEAKGHTLVWISRAFTPSYWPETVASNGQRSKMIDDRIALIAGKFAAPIRSWDVVNEAIRISRVHDISQLPPDYAYSAFQSAAKYFPPTSELILNEASEEAWDEHAGGETPFYLLASGLISRGAKVDSLGLQMHYFSDKEVLDTLNGKKRTPSDLFRTLDLYARLGRPIHISEITIPSLDKFGGEAMQAEIARNLYRLWFSHPAIGSIIWWNIADGTAFDNEDKWLGGLLRKDSLEKKPSYIALEALLNREWVSNLDLVTDANGQVSARVYHGTYSIEVQGGRGKAHSATTVRQGEARSTRIALK